MENTTPFLFDDKDEKYYVAVKGRAVGPLTAKELHERLQRGEASLLHYIWADGWEDWKRIYEDTAFSVLIPQKPSLSSIDYVKESIANRKKKQTQKPEVSARSYFAYFNKSQFGPFSREEILHMIETGKLDQSAFLWIQGWPNWKKLSDIEEFGALARPPAPPAPPAEPAASDPAATMKLARHETKGAGVGKAGKEKTKPTKKTKGRQLEPTFGAELLTQAGVDASEKRGQPRRPLVARLFLHNNQDVIIAICRDISVGGMQVLTDRVPGPVGTKIKLNVSPSDAQSVSGFVAEGEIVRVLEDGRGFSFRFMKISDDARKAIEKYIRLDQ